MRKGPEIEIVGESGSGLEALTDIRKWKPNLVFLDVQMPEIDGLYVLEMLVFDLLFSGVFVTAYEHHALQAFEAGPWIIF